MPNVGKRDCGTEKSGMHMRKGELVGRETRQVECWGEEESRRGYPEGYQELRKCRGWRSHTDRFGGAHAPKKHGNLQSNIRLSNSTGPASRLSDSVERGVVIWIGSLSKWIADQG